MKKYILISDPVISCKYLVHEIHKHNLGVFAFFTSDIKLPYFKKSIDEVVFDEVLVSSNNFLKDMQKINDLLCDKGEIIFCLYGSDYSSAYADKLSEKLTPLLANNANSSELRTSKCEMIKALHQQKIPVPQQLIITKNNISDVEELTFPVVIKPGHNSAGSQDVKLCHDSSVAEKHINKILTGKGLYDLNITHAVVQEFLQGVEYCVNTASYSEEHHLSSIFRYTKTIRNNEFIYRYLDLVHPDSHSSDIAFTYVKNVLRALEFNNGLAHTEIILDNNICKLIELNPRIAGFSGQMTKLEYLATGTNQVDILYKLITNQNDIRVKCDGFHYRMYLLQNFSFVYDSIKVKKFEKLPSFFDYKVMMPSVSSTKESISLTDVAAFIILKNSSKQQLEEDTAIIMDFEENGDIFSKT